ncbi:TPR repeat-containing protein YrrB [Botrimarina colliarenosi]|uniref:TPR repeat-containing protein YrrB n=1 Tax=Botrimarina colliarenosi TaxID=2528001 RepID=A0A5C6AKM7_9BACT|nr:tetratricopeptide repeat protein [Botrimarina colliarenosi]TWT99960.1 TPR repeat-containing protein YrrB [Botrimarina colliarenosi]
MSTHLLTKLTLAITLSLLLGGVQPAWAQEAAVAPAETAAAAPDEQADDASVEASEDTAEDEESAPSEKTDKKETEGKEDTEEKPDAADKPAPPASPEDPDNPGVDALNRAIELKLDAQELKDLNEVVDLLDEAREEGLDSENSEFAEELLVATLLQRAASYSQVVLGQPITDPRRDPRWLTVRQYALTDLQRIVSLDESQATAWLLIGRLQSLPMGSSSEARRALSQVIRLAEAAQEDPDAEAPDATTIAQAYALRGAAQKNAADRLEDFNKAVEIDPSKAEYLLLRAQAHRADGRADECIADIDKAIEMAPDNPKVHELKALALLMQDKQEEALESFDRASELAPDLLSPYQYRGEVFSQLGKLDEAIAQLDKALELQPNNLASLLIRAQLLTANDEFERALADVDSILKQQPGLVRAHLMKAQTLDKLDRTDEAVAWLEKLVAIDPNRPELQMQLAAFYADKQMAPEAIEVLTKVLELDEGNELARRLRGDMYLYAGEHEKAIEDFEIALEQSPMDPGVLNNYAWTLATSPYDNVRDGEKAVELATKAAEVTEYGAPHILSTLAASLAEKGDFDEAVKRSEEAIAKATELDTLGGYDGQLEAELRCYQSHEPWRELQKQGVSGPASKAAAEIADGEKKGDKKDAATVEPEAPVAPVVNETPARSIDF